MTRQDPGRTNEWFVPKFGPESFRILVGLLYLPYTGMCISFVVFGSLLAQHVLWDRLASIIVIYFLGLGISAHAADALGSRQVKPWGTRFTKRQLMLLTVVPLILAYVVGLYYIVFFTPMLAAIAAFEGFFLLAYNFEWFSGRFHNNFWFCIAWGSLPLLAGYVIQTGTISPFAVLAAIPAALASYFEIYSSRPYKKLKRESINSDATRGLERKLKVVSVGTISCALLALGARLLYN